MLSTSPYIVFCYNSNFLQIYNINQRNPRNNFSLHRNIQNQCSLNVMSIIVDIFEVNFMIVINWKSVYYNHLTKMCFDSRSTRVFSHLPIASNREHSRAAFLSLGRFSEKCVLWSNSTAEFCPWLSGVFSPMFHAADTRAAVNGLREFWY